MIRNITKHALADIDFISAEVLLNTAKDSSLSLDVLFPGNFSTVYVRAQFPDKLHYRTVPMVQMVLVVAVQDQRSQFIKSES